MENGTRVYLAPPALCTGCSACFAACGVKAIQMVADSEGFEYPEVAEDKCIGCGRCHSACPVLKQLPGTTPKRVLAAYNIDRDSRLKSSSGGIFPLFARHVLSGGGMVCGASWTSDLGVEHICIDELQKLDLLRGSKYLQSRMGNVFCAVRDHLEKQKTVLFSGTPCQVGGLKSFLGRDYDNLYCLDLICHGVPSASVFGRVIQEMESEFGGRCITYDFRSKATGWRKCSVVARFDNGACYSRSQMEDAFTAGFLEDLYNRPSCSRCPFRGMKSSADLTLADYWRVNLHFADMDDNAGTSIVLLNTPKGNALMQAISDQVVARESTYRNVKAVNPAVYRTFPQHHNRAEFFRGWKTEPIQQLIWRLIAPSAFERLLLSLKRFFYKCRGKFIQIRRSMSH